MIVGARSNVCVVGGCWSVSPGPQRRFFAALLFFNARVSVTWPAPQFFFARSLPFLVDDIAADPAILQCSSLVSSLFVCEIKKN